MYRGLQRSIARAVGSSSQGVISHRRWLSTSSGSGSGSGGGQTLIEKIVQRYATRLSAGQRVRSGDYVSIVPAHILTHDNTSAVMIKFNAFWNKPSGTAAGNGVSGEPTVHNPKQPVFVLDHNVQDKSEGNLKKYRAIESFAVKHNINFYPAGRGIGHQVMCEEGYALPHTLVVASDSHANMYGGLGCVGTPVVRTDAASIWATGKTWVSTYQPTTTNRMPVTDRVLCCCFALSLYGTVAGAADGSG